MRLHTHDYRAPDTDGIVDGAILMHREMTELLTEGAEVTWHNLATGPTALASARAGDTVYAGSGPYAFLHHLWRERSGQDFRIVREVHTALWSGYWAQEELCAALLREDDLVLFPTEYTRQLYIRMFPALTEDNSAVAYPMLDRLPAWRSARVPEPDEPLRIGYLGALSLAKNFDQVLSVFLRCHRAAPGTTLTCAGKPNHPQWETSSVAARLDEHGVPRDALRMRGVLPPEKLADFFAGIDVLLFPSTASRETLGRVVLEALAHGVPVLAADMGPAVELLPARNLVPTTLDTEGEHVMSRVGPLGRVDEGVLLGKLLTRDFEPARIAHHGPYQHRTFWDVLAGKRPGPVPGHDRSVADRLRVEEREGDLTVALRDAERLFTSYFGRRDDQVLEQIARSADDPGPLRPLVSQPGRNLADYRSFPRLLDALVLSPLTYTLAAGLPADPPKGTQ